MNLPGIRTTIACAHCYADTGHDDGWFTCDSCGLGWSGDPFDDVEAFFLDEDAEPCAQASTEPPWITTHYTFHEEPCSLPAGHASDHYFFLGSERTAA